jgi:hypothetical protein
MKTSKAVIILSILVGVLALVQAGAGLFWPGGSRPFNFTTLHGQTVQMSGQGVYAFDTYFKAPILRGTDALTLVVCLPLLVIALLWYRRGALRGGLLLAGVLAFYLYNAASIALGAAYNNLFLLYVAYFSASLFSFVLACTAVDVHVLAENISPGLPHRGIATLLFLSGLALLLAWTGDIVGPLMKGTVPGIASYTTEVTYVFDLGIITPVCFLAGVLILRRAPVSYLMAAIMLVMLGIVGLMVTTQTVFQLLAGISLTTGEFVGKSGTFMLLALIAIWLMARFFSCVTEPGSARPVAAMAAR